MTPEPNDPAAANPAMEPRGEVGRECRPVADQTRYPGHTL